MNLKHIFLLLGGLLSLSPLWGQNEIDALRHSQTGLMGTARSLGMGGAFSAAGADLSAAALNPAGLGLYRSSSLVVSPSFMQTLNRSDYLGINQTQAETNLTLPNLGLAFTELKYRNDGGERRERQQGLKSYTFAFGYHQRENYNRNAVGEGAYNPFSSISENYADLAQGIFVGDLDEQGDPFYDDLSGIAYEAFIIDAIDDSSLNRYFPAVAEGQIEQSFQIIESGRRNEWYVALGGNFGDKFYLGGSLNLQSIRYENTFNFNEVDVDNLYQFYDPVRDNFPPPGEPGFDLEIPMQEIRIVENFSTQGSGLSGQIGMIYRPVDALRLGLSAQTPTYFTLTDQYSTDIEHTFNGENADETITVPSGTFESNYTLFTPFRLTGGAMVLLKKLGFLTVDAEYVDYSSAELSSGVSSINNPDFYAFEIENQRIDELYRGVVNLRVGGEARLGVFRARAGYAYYPSPFQPIAEEYLTLDDAAEGDFRSLVGQDPADVVTPERLDGARTFFTAGAGVRQPNFFLDVSLVYQQQADKLSPYSISDPTRFQPTIVNRVSRTTFTASLGFHF